MSTAEAETTEAAAPEEERPFNPSERITQISGKDYLEVKWRLVWLRDRHPDAVIETELVRDDGALAIFKARVTIPTGGSATGWGSETEGDFHDYLEKSETKALGRALAALGFGTQFCDDHNFDTEGRGRVVDSTVGRGEYQKRRGVSDPATERQIKALYAIGRAGHLSDADIAKRSQEQYGAPPEQLQRRDASHFIDWLKQEMGAVIDTDRIPLVGGADPRKPEQPRPATAEELSGKPERSIPGALDDLRAAIADRNYSWLYVKAMCKRVHGTADVTTLTSVQQIDLLRGVVEDTHHEVQFDAGQSRIAVGPAPVGAAS